MKLTIVTISFNQHEFLEQCLLSVLSQKADDVEYIVVDPGSTDGSREIIEKFRASIDYVVFEKDNGPADGLNRGFSRGSGEIFGFINADDSLLPGALEHVKDFFDEHRDVDVVSGNGLVIDSYGCEIRKCYSDRFSAIGYAYGSCGLVQPSTFFRSSLFHRVGGFNEGNKTNWDGELFLDMVLAGARFARSQQFLSCYRLHSSSITASGKYDSAIRAHGHYIFRKVKGRRFRFSDYIVGFLFRLFKHLSNPPCVLGAFEVGSYISSARMSGGMG